MPKHIFCDEAGSTGQNLLDPAQPFFAYAAVALEPANATALVTGLRRSFKPQGDELKGRLLVASSPGRKFVTALLQECAKISMVSIWEKRYALASQFFEHAFEPVLAQQNALFYRIGFHRFISNLLYMSFAASTPRALHTMAAFQRIVRARGAEPVDSLFLRDGTLFASSDELHDIEAFVLCHRNAVAGYISTSSERDPMQRWSLDASLSAIWSLLTSWSSRFDPDSLIVTCDVLRPLYDVRDHFNRMIGRTDRPLLEFPAGRHSPVFNLAEPVRFGISHEHAGIQIADVVAAATIHAFRNLRDKQSTEWLRLLGDGVHAIVPDARWIDLRSPEGAVNAVVLKELVSRSIQKRDLFVDMDLFIQSAFASFPGYRQGLEDSHV